MTTQSRPDSFSSLWGFRGRFPVSEMRRPITDSRGERPRFPRGMLLVLVGLSAAGCTAMRGSSHTKKQPTEEQVMPEEKVLDMSHYIPYTD